MSARVWTRMIVAVVGGVFIISSSVPALGQARASTQLRISIGALPRTLDPTFDTSSTAQAVYKLMLEPLVDIDEQGQPQPLLATSWHVLNDTTWQFKLRRGVKWHNGDRFTAADVKSTIERVLAPATKAPWKARVEPIQRVDIVDELTVNIVTDKPFALMLKGLAIIFILPSKYWREQGEAGFNRRPIGTGMYRFVEWERENFLTLSLNRDYWGEPAKLGSVLIRHMPEVATRVAALETGEVDIAYAVPPEQIDRLKSKGFVIASANIGQIININMSPIPNSPMSDRRVRQALNYAVDKDAIIKNIMGGFGRKLDGQLVGPDAFGYNPKVKNYPYDPVRARRLLADAGYANGFEVSFIGTLGRYPKDKEIGEAVVGYLSAVGIRAKMEILESGVWLSKLYVRGAMGPLWMSGWIYFPGLDAQLPMTFFQCESVVWVMCNKDFDRIFDEASRATDFRKRRELLQKGAEIIHEEAPIIFLHQIPAIFGLNPRVKGVKLLPDWSLDISKVTIESR